MVNITSIARSVAEAYAAACLLGASPSVPHSHAAAAVAAFFLPGAVQFSLGKITQYTNETILATEVAKEMNEKDVVGYGNNFTMEALRIETVSDESAAVWITWHNWPKSSCFEEYVVLDLYGFRVDANATNGLGGGWEFVVPDNGAIQWKRVMPR